MIQQYRHICILDVSLKIFTKVGSKDVGELRFIILRRRKGEIP
jgi:hypothetical protein